MLQLHVTQGAGRFIPRPLHAPEAYNKILIRDKVRFTPGLSFYGDWFSPALTRVDLGNSLPEKLRGDHDICLLMIHVCFYR